LASVLRQDVPPSEVIVVAHGEVEVPADVVRDDRVRVIALGATATGAARAAGLEAACGPYRAHCDELATWTPDHRSRLRREIEAHPGTAVVYARVAWVDAKGRPVETPDLPAWPAGKQAPFIVAGGVVHRVAAARIVGGFDWHFNAF